MPDRISNYRQVTLTFNPSHTEGYRVRWDLACIEVKKGVPRRAILESGYLATVPWDVDERGIWRAIWEIVRDAHSD